MPAPNKKIEDTAPKAPSRQSGRTKGGTTLIEVARLAGVSPMSASRALSSPHQVSGKILTKVLAAVESTGYVANQLASGLASRRSRLVAAVIPSVAGSVFQEMIQSLIAELAESNYQLMLGQSGYGAQREDTLLDAIIGRRPDGIVLGGVVPSAKGRQRLIASDIPIVQTWDMVRSPIDMVVGFSHEAIAAAVAVYFLERNRTRLAFIGGNHERARRRGRAFAAAALGDTGSAEHTTPPVIETVAAPGTVRSGRNALRRILRQQPDTDAIFCSSDLIALGVLTEAQSLGLSVPGRLAIMGFGDLSFAGDIIPALTTVRIDGGAIGRHAGRFIVDRTEGREVLDRIVDLGFTIVERESA